MEHTPKNILLRAVLKKKPTNEVLQKNLEQLRPTLEFLQANPTLYQLLKKDKTPAVLSAKE